MKEHNPMRNHIIKSGLVALCLSATTYAADPTSPATNPNDPLKSRDPNTGTSGTGDSTRYSNPTGSQNLEHHRMMSSANLVSSDKLIGEDVTDQSGDEVGEVSALIIDLQSGVAPIAVVSVGGIAGVGATKVAVPTHLLQCTTDGDGDRKVTISASEEELKAAAKEPAGSWTQVGAQEWTKDIDGFYGQLQPAGSMNRSLEHPDHSNRTLDRTSEPDHNRTPGSGTSQ